MAKFFKLFPKKGKDEKGGAPQEDGPAKLKVSATILQFKLKSDPPEKVEVPEMMDGAFYDLKTPAIIHGKEFFRIQCEYAVVGHPNEYVVSGIPYGEDKVELFLLRFSGKGNVVPILSKDQDNL